MTCNETEADSEQNKTMSDSFRAQSLWRNKTSSALTILLILGIVSLFLSGLPAYAQDAPPTSETERPFLPTAHFRHLTTADGLPVNAIEDIYQDSRGFIWIATADGLVQYDGYTITTYKHDPFDDNSLSHNHVQAIVEDENGRLWLATEGGGVNSYDPVTNQFTRYPYAPDTPNSFIGSTVLSAFKDNHNNIWFGSPPPFGISRMNTVTGETAQYFQEKGIDGLAWDGIVDQQGTLWIITDRNLNRYDPQSDTFTSYPVPTKDNHLTSIVQTEDGRLWMGRMDGLYTFDPQSEKLSGVGNFRAIEAMQLVDNGRLWIGTHSDGLYLYDLQTETVLNHFVANAADIHSLSDNYVTTLFVDDTGLLWIGTESGGVDLYDPRSSQFAHYRHDLLNENSLAATVVTAITGDDQGNLWVVNKTDWNVVDLTAGRVSRHSTTDFYSDRIPVINSILYDSQGMVWLGLDAGNLLQVNPKTGTVTPFHLYPPDPNNSLAKPPTPIFGLAEDAEGNLWAVGMRDGLFKLDANRQNIQTIQAPLPGQPPTENTLAEFQVTTLTIDHAGTVWLGYASGHLSRLDHATNLFTHYLKTPESGNPSGYVRQIFEDANGRIWLATDAGLIRFDPESETFERFARPEGFPTNSIQAVQQAANGDLWVSTSNGLVQFDPEAETVIHVFDESDGLQGNEFMAAAAWQDEDGRLYFGGSNGITAFYPDQIKTNPYQPTVLLTELRLFNEAVCCDNALLDQAIWNTKELTFAHDQNVISFDFAALSYAAPEKNQYRYRLEGFEENWNEVGSNRRTATYTNLPAGTYTLRVQGSNNYGVWSEQEAVLEITVLPPWWETLWFRIAAVLSLILLGVGLSRWRVSAIHRRNRELEAEVARQTEVVRAAEAQKQYLAVLEERQRIGRELHDDLGQVMGFVNLQAQSALQRLARHELNEAQGILTQLAEIAQNASTKVREYILGIRITEHQPPGNFLAELKQLADSQKQLYGLDVSLSHPDDWQTSPFSIDVERQLLRIIQEALANIRKHAGVTDAHVSFTQFATEAQLIIADEGHGFDPQAIAVDDPEGHFGLTIMRERAESVDGRLEIRSEPNVYTQVIVTVPLVLEPVKVGPSAREVRVLLVDDHPLYLEGLRNLLASRGFQVIGQAYDGQEALEKARALYPDLILMDVQMPRMDGVEATQQIMAELPKTKIVMLTMGAEDETLFAALKSGATGYLLKSMAGDQFFRLLTDAIAGETVFSPSLASRVLLEFSQQHTAVTPTPDLTDRQREVLELAAAGLSNKEIAAKIYISETTVKYHIRQILERLHLKSRHEFKGYLTGGEE